MEDFYDDSSPYLDYNKDIRIKKNHLTLWDQPGKIQSVTFRLNDSIPAKERKLLNGLKETFEKLNPRPWKREIQLNYYKLIGKRQEMLLDQGYGSCFFKNPNIRKILCRVNKQVQN